MTCTYLPIRCKLHNNKEVFIHADSNQFYNMWVVKLFHDICMVAENTIIDKEQIRKATTKTQYNEQYSILN